MNETGLLISLFLFVMAAVTAAGYVFVLRPREADRGDAGIPVQLTAPTSGRAPWQAVIIDMFRLMGEAMPGSRDEGSELRQRLIAAGYRWPSAFSVFYGIKCALALAMAVATGWVATQMKGDALGALVPIVCGVGFGYVAPDILLGYVAKSRAGRLRRGLPAALDLMVLGIEAGQAMDQAILDTSRGLRNTHFDLAQEFTRLHLELRASSSRADSLRAFAQRNQEPELRKIANLLIDADRFGTGLGPALRSHAKYLRIRFRQGAQERARKIGVKLIFPVFFLIFPSVILVTLGPALIMVSNNLKKLLNGF